MAFGFYFNMEPLALNIAQKHIKQMTNNNRIKGNDLFLDDEKLLNNIENGFVALTQLSCYLESFLNTILSSCMNYQGETLLKSNIQEKIEIIYMYYKKDWNNLKSLHCWEIYRGATNVRNEMIHYKKAFIGDASGVPDFKIGKKEASVYFTKDNLEDVYKNYVIFCETVANHLDLKLFSDVDIFSCDGRDGLVRYVYNPLTTDIDETRFTKTTWQSKDESIFKRIIKFVRNLI